MPSTWRSSAQGRWLYRGLTAALIKDYGRTWRPYYVYLRSFDLPVGQEPWGYLCALGAEQFRGYPQSTEDHFYRIDLADMATIRLTTAFNTYRRKNRSHARRRSA